jgi:hypothetical protein
MPSFARQILLGTTSALAAASIGLTAAGVYKARRQPRGPIFLPSRPDSPLADTSADAMRQMMEGSSWLTSFCEWWQCGGADASAQRHDAAELLFAVDRGANAAYQGRDDHHSRAPAHPQQD